MLGILSGRPRAYGYRHTERFLSETAQAGGDATLTEALAIWTHQLWPSQFQSHQEASQSSPATFYVDGHHKAVYSDPLIPRGLVGKLGKVLGYQRIRDVTKNIVNMRNTSESDSS